MLGGWPIKSPCTQSVVNGSSGHIAEKITDSEVYYVAATGYSSTERSVSEDALNGPYRLTGAPSDPLIMVAEPRAGLCALLIGLRIR